jgi:hypothetical protein
VTTPGITWNRTDALAGVSFAIPAGVVTLFDVPSGVALSVGVIPAAIVGIQPTRAQRKMTALLGFVVGAPIVVGALLATLPWLAVTALLLGGIGSASLARRWPLGSIAMTLGLPMMAVGLSYDDPSSAIGLAAIMVAGSLYAWLISLAWPEFTPGGTAHAPGVTPSPGYGLRLGLAGALAAVIGFGLHLDHVGWACAAALLVMRPSADMQRVRSVGRVLSVVVGASLGVVMALVAPAPALYALVVVAVVTLAAATHRSRWYLTSAFTTFLVFVLLLFETPDDAAFRFGERVGETILGVAIAYLFGLAVPEVMKRLRAPGTSSRR